MSSRGKTVEVKIYTDNVGSGINNAKRLYCANSLFNGNKEVYILHGDQQYKLSITKADKLILTK